MVGRIVSAVMDKVFMGDGYDPTTDTKGDLIREVEDIRTTMTKFLMQDPPAVLDEVITDIRTACRGFMSIVDGNEPGPPPTEDVMALRETIRRLLRYATGDEEYVAPFVIMVEATVEARGQVRVLAATEEEARRIFEKEIESGRPIGIAVDFPLPGLQKASNIRITGIGH